MNLPNLKTPAKTWNTPANSTAAKRYCSQGRKRATPIFSASPLASIFEVRVPIVSGDKQGFSDCKAVEKPGYWIVGACMTPMSLSDVRKTFTIFEVQVLFVTRECVLGTRRVAVIVTLRPRAPRVSDPTSSPCDATSGANTTAVAPAAPEITPGCAPNTAHTKAIQEGHRA
jgi:hypothetical protein